MQRVQACSLGSFQNTTTEKPKNPSHYSVNIGYDDTQYSPPGCGVTCLCETHPWVCLNDLPSRREQTHLCFDDSSTLPIVSGADRVQATLSQGVNIYTYELMVWWPKTAFPLWSFWRRCTFLHLIGHMSSVAFVTVTTRGCLRSGKYSALS